MKDKYKSLIIIGIITILLIILIILLLESNNKIKSNELTTINNTSTSTTNEVSTTTTSSEIETTTTTISSTTTRTTISSTKDVTTSSSTTTKVITYSCPNGYLLNNNKCTKKVQAERKCPDGYSIASDETCINLSAGYEINENDTCPSGYQYLTLISLFGPDTYQCQPISGYIYVCNEGTLINNECYITVDPIAN